MTEGGAQRGLGAGAKWTLLVLSAIPLALATRSRQQGDLPHYFEIARALWSGAVPYREIWIEYPPYAVLCFLPFGLIADERTFGIVFGLFLVAVDGAIKAVLLKEGQRLGAWRGLVPFALFTLVSWIQAFWYLKRFDLIPAALTVAVAVAASKRQDGRAGTLLSLAIGTKIYAVILAPVLLLISRHGRAERRFLIGMALGLLPLLLLSAVWPWWSFAVFQAGRGLQVESLLASVLWLMKQLGAIDVRWVGAEAAYELHGRAPALLHGWVDALWAAVVSASVVVSARVARAQAPVGAPEIARLLLLPVLALVAFGPVLSPQFTIWLTGLSALALFASRGPAVVILLAAALTRLVYPAPHYQTGLDLAHTLVLLARNALLVGAWVALFRQLLLQGEVRISSAASPEPGG